MGREAKRKGNRKRERQGFVMTREEIKPRGCYVSLMLDRYQYQERW
jgi:hypothetical protein